MIRRRTEINDWISVKDRLPANEETVLACVEVRLVSGKPYRIVVMAFHTDGKMNTEDSSYWWDNDNIGMEYDEESDSYIVPEGWWESVSYGEEFSCVSDFVTHWMPLPTPPKENKE